MSRRTTARRQAPIRLIPYASRSSAAIAVHGSLAVALDTGPPQRTLRPILGLVRGGPPGVRAEARLIAQMILDVMAGARPYHHLAGRTTPQIFERLSSLAARTPGRSLPRLGRLRVCEPGPGVAEVTAIASIGPRVQALALRLEHDRGRWRCAVIETTVPGP